MEFKWTSVDIKVNLNFIRRATRVILKNIILHMIWDVEDSSISLKI